MTPEDIAELLDRAYVRMRPWSAGEIRDTLATPTALCETAPHGAILGRVVADEAEILAFATAPDQQSRGIGSALLERFETAALERGAVTCFLETAAGNTGAIRFYEARGFAVTGRRKGYYHLRDGSFDDAVLMCRQLA